MTDNGKVHDDGLAGAVRELHEQHPQRWNDLGPHHGPERPHHHPHHEPAVRPNPSNPWANGHDGQKFHKTVGAKK